MFFKLITLLSLFSTNAFNIPNIKIPSKVINPLLQDYNPLQRFSDIEINEKRIGHTMVESITSSLPHFDSISHTVLDTNSKVVSYVLNKNDIPDSIKKQLVLISIKMAQEGDNMGSHILQIYYDIVNNCI
mgnify:FL=1